MMQYGFQNLVLLNSAGYQRAELPLDASVSLIAPNNAGKTSLINALQYMLIIDQRRMDFGAYKNSQKFYFPSNSSYILLEISLPQTGTVVFGCVGKGASYDYEYFAYKGSLDIEHFRLESGALVQQPQLLSHLASLGKNAYHYNAVEFAQLIYGKNSSVIKSGRPDFTIFKLEHSSDAQVFQQVLTRTLRLDKLNSANVKEYLMKIFTRDLSDPKIDFKQEWDKAFSEVNDDWAQYQAAFNQLDLIEKLEHAYFSRLTVRGKLIYCRPLVDQGLADWYAHYQAQHQHLQEQLDAVIKQENNLRQQDRERLTQELERQQQLQQLEQLQHTQAKLAMDFELVASRTQLEQERQSCQRRLDELTSVLVQVQDRSRASIEKSIQEKKQQLSFLHQQQRSLANNLYQELAKQLSSEQLDRLNRVLSNQVMILPSSDVELDYQRLAEALAESDSHQLTLSGITFPVAVLNSQYKQRTAAELIDDIHITEREITELNQQLDTAVDLEKYQIKKRQLQQALHICQNNLNDYDNLQQLTEAEPERLIAQQTLAAELADIQQTLAMAEQEAEMLRQQRQHYAEMLSQLQAKNQIISKYRDNRGDQNRHFEYLAEQAHHPWLAEPEWKLENLAEQLNSYQSDCRQLQELDSELQRLLAIVRSGGFTRYQFSNHQDQELQRIIDFKAHLPREQQALEKKARSAVVNVTACLRALHDGLLSFQSKIREFNRLISGRRLSDLKTFKVEALKEDNLVNAIEILIEKSEQVSTNENFELFNQASVLDDVALDQAKQILINEGSARNGLKVADLFRLEFVLAKIGQASESFEDLDGAASNGTVLMAKLVTGLAMLHLMQDKRHKLNAVCYLDEALALDSHNQASLIATAHEFGYSLIFASPSPLTTVRYCVPIHKYQGSNYIMRDSWQVFDSLESLS